jgi:hypothetical protein
MDAYPASNTTLARCFVRAKPRRTIGDNSVVSDGFFSILGGIAAAVTLALYAAIEVVKPAWRRRQMRHPCHVWFNIMGPSEGKISYAIQDGRPHHVRELVLAANSEIEIEVIYTPKLAFYESTLAFGCEGDSPGKPYATERFTRFVLEGKGKSQWIPGVDESDTIDRHKFYWIKRHEVRNIGTHFIIGYKLKTQSAGIFPMKVFFTTDEFEGSADLSIRVEERPNTPMQCAVKEHYDCYVYPLDRHNEGAPSAESSDT